MNKLTLLAIFFCSVAHGQNNITESLEMQRLKSDTAAMRKYEDNLRAFVSSMKSSDMRFSKSSPLRPNSIRFMGAEINNEYMRIDSAGNLYYKTSAFCKCDTANKMVFLLNIFNPQRSNHEPKY
mgnify:CR=1 FL=1